MAKDNKIISFDRTQKKRKKAQYKLKAEISIHIQRIDEKYKIDWYSPDKTLSEEDIYMIQKNILSNLAKEVREFKFKEKDYYEVEFTLLYYEKSRKHFKYICMPQDIKKEKLTEYLYVSINVYELKKSGAI